MFINAWDFKPPAWEREMDLKCVSITPNAWDLTGLKHGDADATAWLSRCRCPHSMRLRHLVQRMFKTIHISRIIPRDLQRRPFLPATFRDFILGDLFSVNKNWRVPILAYLIFCKSVFIIILTKSSKWIASIYLHSHNDQYVLLWIFMQFIFIKVKMIVMR